MMKKKRYNAAVSIFNIPIFPWCIVLLYCIHSNFLLADSLQKREKRRWLFRKPSNSAPHQNVAKVTAHCAPPPPRKTPSQLPPDQRHAIAVAAATAAAAEAAVATAQAAVEIIRLTRSSDPTSAGKQNYNAAAATLIQTAFRGYLVSHHYLLPKYKYYKSYGQNDECFLVHMQLTDIEKDLIDCY